MKYKFLIGIMIPTRKRIQFLKECLDSFNTKTKDKSLVELLLKIDSDDLDTLKFAEAYKSKIEIKICVTDRKKGYGSLHEHYDSLAKISESEFLQVFNDDIEMLTQDWEQQIIPYSGKYNVLAVKNERIKNGEKISIFDGYNGNPIIPRFFYEDYGTLSEHPMLDDWWVNVTNAVPGLQKWLDITVWFKRPDGEYTDFALDETFSEGRAHINWSHHGSKGLNDYINYIKNCVLINPEKF